MKDCVKSATIPTLKRATSVGSARRATKEISSCAINVAAGTVRHVQVSRKLNFKTSLIRLTSALSAVRNEANVNKLSII